MAVEYIYDDLLVSKLPHLKMHKNYLPHIGKNFEKASQRIMIVAESHYISSEFNDLINVENWYKEPESIYETIGDIKGWFDTRGVLANYLYNRKSKGGLSIFYNLEKAFRNVFEDSDLFNECVYINYYQRPSEREGDSIKVNPYDSKIALENILILIDVLKLDKVIFVSSKAYNDFKSKTTKDERESLPYIGAVPHPSASSWWNRKSTKYGLNGSEATGKEKFERIIKPKVENAETI